MLASFSSFHSFYIQKLSYTIDLLEIYHPLKQYILSTPKKPDGASINPQESFTSIGSAHIDPVCIFTEIFLPYLHLSEVFDHPLNDKALKIFHASQHYFHNELLFLIAESTVFLLRRDNIGTLLKDFHNLHLMLKLTLLQKIMKTSNLKSILILMINQQNLEKCLTWVNKLNNWVNRTELITPKNLTLRFSKKDLHRIHASYFSCPILQLSLKTKAHSSSELQSAVTLQKQVFTVILPSKKQ